MGRKERVKKDSMVSAGVTGRMMVLWKEGKGRLEISWEKEQLCLRSVEYLVM